MTSTLWKTCTRRAQTPNPSFAAINICSNAAGVAYWWPYMTQNSKAQIQTPICANCALQSACRRDCRTAAHLLHLVLDMSKQACSIAQGAPRVSNSQKLVRVVLQQWPQG